jgi:hypothetical protein
MRGHVLHFRVCVLTCLDCKINIELRTSSHEVQWLSQTGGPAGLCDIAPTRALQRQCVRFLTLCTSAVCISDNHG